MYGRVCKVEDKVTVPTSHRAISLIGHILTLFDKTPFILRGQDGMESPSTKLRISEVSISCDDKDNESAIVRLGCVLRSYLILAKMHNRDRSSQDLPQVPAPVV